MQSKKDVHHLPMPLLRAVSICTAALVASGCAVPYKEPTGKSTATIEFIDDASDKMSVHLHGDAKECTDRASAGFVASKSQRALTIPAGDQLVFTVGMDAGSAGQLALAFGAIGVALMPTYVGCTPTIDFVPEVGKSYVFRMNSDGKNCSFRFYGRSAVSQKTEDLSPVTFTTREWIRANGEAGPWCKKRVPNVVQGG
jgi:hypothetical protein